MLFSRIWMHRLLLGTILSFHIQHLQQQQASVLIVAAFSSRKTVSTNRLQLRESFNENGLDEIDHGQRIHLTFSSKSAIPPFHENAAFQQLILSRRDGIDLHGREIVHTQSDARSAILSILHTNTVKASKDSHLWDKKHHWDATLLLHPQNADTSDTDHHLFFMPNDDAQPCFVAMNRFQVKESCKMVFEDRWAQRQSKLPSQPGFVGFSLLRRRRRSLPAKQSQEHDRFNYSTCTIWDSIDCWKQWRNGGGKTSHQISNDTKKTRVPVSEWLEGPSSPIFWDGTLSRTNDTHSTESENLLLDGLSSKQVKSL